MMKSCQTLRVFSACYVYINAEELSLFSECWVNKIVLQSKTPKAVKKNNSDYKSEFTNSLSQVEGLSCAKL